MEFKPSKPVDASALILLNDDCDRILWARRNPKLRFLGGFHSFPGGKVDPTDRLSRVENAVDAKTGELIACSVRETFEETGVLLVRNGDKLTKGQIVSLHDDLVSDRSTFADILDHWDLWIDASDFEFAGTWTTPEFSRLRFRTAFYAAKCPPKQTPYAAISELQQVEWIAAESALEKWSNSKVLIAPPLLGAIKAFSNTVSDPDSNGRLTAISKNSIEYAEKHGNGPDYIRLNSRLTCIPLRTKTLPPATHTNCYVVGNRRFIIIDAASPERSEQEKLFVLLDRLHGLNHRCAAIVVSHLHPDHIGGENSVKEFYRERYSLDIPVVAHQITIESLKGKVAFDEVIPESYMLQDTSGTDFELEVLYTPGHARGHLCFYDREFGFLLSSDNVVGEGSVVIAPPEGNMTDYLNSLRFMKSLPGLRFLAGSHGAAISDAPSKIQSYIDHRLEREAQILELIGKGATDVDEIVASVYVGLDERLVPLARKSVEAHIEKLAADKTIGTEWFREANS